MTTLINRFTGIPVTSPVKLTLGVLVTAGGALALLALGRPRRDPAAPGVAAPAARSHPPVRLHPEHLDRFMLFAAGMMLAAALFSLLVPALSFATAPLAVDVLAALAGGWLLMRALDRWMPHRHPGEAAAGATARQTLRLVVIAIAVHNLPEGFAVGAGFGGGSSFGWSTAASIGIQNQNIPEGLIVATALWALGAGRWAAAAGALATGLVEPVGAAFGVAASGLVGSG